MDSKLFSSPLMRWAVVGLLLVGGVVWYLTVSILGGVSVSPSSSGDNLISTSSLDMFGATSTVVVRSTSTPETYPSVATLKSKRRSEAAIIRDDVRYDIYLYAPDEAATVQTASCAASAGDKKYTGSYQLFAVKDGKVVSRLWLGKRYVFYQGLRDDRLMVFSVRATGGSDVPLVDLRQFALCGVDHMELFGVDRNGAIYQAHFTGVNGAATNQLTGTLQSLKGDLINVWRESGIAGTVHTDTYTFDGMHFRLQ